MGNKEVKLDIYKKFNTYIKKMNKLKQCHIVMIEIIRV